MQRLTHSAVSRPPQWYEPKHAGICWRGNFNQGKVSRATSSTPSAVVQLPQRVSFLWTSSESTSMGSLGQRWRHAGICHLWCYEAWPAPDDGIPGEGDRGNVDSPSLFAYRTTMSWLAVVAACSLTCRKACKGSLVAAMRQGRCAGLPSLFFSHTGQHEV